MIPLIQYQNSSDLRKAPQEATQTCTGNSNLHINYVSMEVRQKYGNKAEFSSDNSQIPTRIPQERAIETRQGKSKASVLGMFQHETPLLHHQSSSAALDGYQQHCFCVSGQLELVRRRVRSGGEGSIKGFQDLPSCLLPFSSPSDHFLTERALK